MSISHSPQPPTPGDAGCGQAKTTSGWGWLTQRVEQNVEDDFGRWVDERLRLMEVELSEFASNQSLVEDQRFR